MDPFEKELREALMDIAKKMVRDMFKPDTVDWLGVYELVRRYSEVGMAMPEAQEIPAELRQKIIEDAALHTTKIIKRHIIGGLIPGAMMLVWRSFAYSLPHQWRERAPLLQIKTDKDPVERFEKQIIYPMWQNYWERFEPGSLRDPRGQRAQWDAATLMDAINKAAPKVPVSRWSYHAVAQKITQNEQLKKPLTGAALRMHIKRKGLTEFWEQWEQKKKRT